jgi:hypothetical protein
MIILWCAIVLWLGSRVYFFPIILGVFLSISDGSLFRWPGMLAIPFIIFIFLAVLLAMYFWGGMIVMALLDSNKPKRD